MTDKMHHTTDRKQNQKKKTLCPTVVLRGMSRRRMGYLVRLSGKSLSFSCTRLMTSTNIPSSSTFSRLHITFSQSALLMVNRTTPRTPRKASSTATDFPDWKRPPMMVALYRQLLMRSLMVSISGLLMTSSSFLVGSKGSMALATAARILPSGEALKASSAWRFACSVASFACSVASFASSTCRYANAANATLAMKAATLTMNSKKSFFPANSSMNC